MLTHTHTYTVAGGGHRFSIEDTIGSFEKLLFEQICHKTTTWDQ